MTHDLIAEFESPRPGTLLIYEVGPGWKIAAYNRDGSLIGDRWEERLVDIPRYIEDYTDDDLSWRFQASGQSVDLTAFVAKNSGPA